MEHGGDMTNIIHHWENVQKLLPDGYNHLELLTGEGGYMEGHALFAKAKLTKPDLSIHNVFLKIFIIADENCGSKTTDIRGPLRIERLKSRIQLLQSQSNVPVVHIHNCIQLEDEYLVLTMEEVTPLSRLNDTDDYNELIGFRSTLAQKILRDLWGTYTENWHHFDVCSSNTGLTKFGDVVFIDIESLYQVLDEKCVVSVPAIKQARIPEEINMSLRDVFENGFDVPNRILNKKQKFDILLLAAEVFFDSTPRSTMRGFTIASLDRWFDLMPELDSKAKNFWYKHLKQALNDIDSILIEKISLELQDLTKTTSESQDSKSNNDPTSTINYSIDEYGKLLRQGRLNIQDMFAYSRTLEHEINARPDNLVLWEELLLVYTGYLRNPEQILILADRALKQFPQNRDFEQWKNIATTWLGGL